MYVQHSRCSLNKHLEIGDYFADRDGADAVLHVVKCHAAYLSAHANTKQGLHLRDICDKCLRKVNFLFKLKSENT
jgi:hypothetical protein